MAKLYFRYGTMGSSKTLNLLAVAHNYRQQGKKVILLKPHLDNRFGADSITSRAGLEMRADVLVGEETKLLELDFSGVSCLLCDEAQFLSPRHIEELRFIALHHNIPVICYGLRTDFRSRLFHGSQRLMELSDAIEEVKATCFFCNRKSTMNLRFVEGKAVVEGPVIQLGAEEKYLPACYACYDEQIKLGREELALAASASTEP